MFNARAESIMTKPAFREPFKRSRAIIISDGFFEWQKMDDPDKKKQPFRIHLKSREVFGMAGLWDTWKALDGKEIATCSIVTTTPNILMGPIHDRMPVILPKEHEAAWLDAENHDTDQLIKYLVPYSTEDMVAYNVSPMVGSVKNNTPECIQSLA